MEGTFVSDKHKKQWTNRRGAQPVSDLVSKLLDPVIERRAGMTMDLLASWEEIVGSRHASLSRPEKLNWPRRAAEDDPFEPATLVVACESGHAVFLQHDSDNVVARVNDYFGFSAVKRLKLLQKPVNVAPSRTVGNKISQPDDNPSQLDELIKDVEDPDLKKALEKLGRGVFSRRSSRER
jgi:hypothetical protein